MQSKTGEKSATNIMINFIAENHSYLFNTQKEYIFGYQADSLENLPEGFVGFDTGLNKFTSITFRAQILDHMYFEIQKARKNIHT